MNRLVSAMSQLGGQLASFPCRVFPTGGELDAIFCRNVMIYFDSAVQQRLVSHLERLLRPGGLLVIAHSETLNGIVTSLRPLHRSVYRKPGGPTETA